MKFTCNSCGSQYMISDEKVGPGGVKVRCKKCGNVVLVRRATEDDAAAAAPAPAASGNGAAGPAAGGLDAELGQAFDNAFGDAPPAAEPSPDLGATQAMAPEDQAKVAAAAAAPAPTEWYVAIGQAQVGPLPLAEVKRKWEAGDVGPDSLVWRPGMGDWQPLSSVSELASYLAPTARPTSSAPRAETPAPRQVSAAAEAAAAESQAPAPAAGAEVSWKPVGASALAALASEEIASRSAPVERRAPSGPATPSGVKSLVEGLPDGGGVDPTGAIPLSIKGMEITGEKKLERRSSVATRAEEARHKRSMTRVIAIAAAVVVVAVGGAAAFVLTQRKAEPVAVAPPSPVTPPPAAQPAPPPAAAAPPPAPAPTPPAAVAAATPPPAPAAQPEPPPARPAPEPPAHKAAPLPKGKHPRVARAEPPPRAAPAPRAAAEAPAPPPRAGKKKDSLLDFDSSDDALNDALGGGGGGSGRAVYVPPAPGGGGALPAKLSPAQINEAVAGRMDSLQRCVSEQRSRDASAKGVLKLKWIITGDGGVRDVRSLPGDYASSPFSTCITAVVKGIRFPRSTTAGQEVTFPFSF